MKVAMANTRAHQVMVARWPKRSASQPVAGVATAVATMLKVITQDTSSWVADSAPCSWGSSAEEIRTERGIDGGAQHQRDEQQHALQRRQTVDGRVVVHGAAMSRP